MSAPEPQSRLCYACGTENEQGLHMRFRREGDRTICDYTPCEYQQGYPGRMHGGVLATLIDEALAWAAYHSAKWVATARLNVRFRKPIYLDQPLRIEAWVVRDRTRLIEARAEVRDTAGALLAEGEGTLMAIDPRIAAEMSELARKTGRSDAPEVVM
ncbi:MAG: PaaI family thioesterase [Chloroflexota bacterium]|nr:PaaI family thioesterase [Chloroflexota bacterium]